jgi:hypothetical protein
MALLSGSSLLIHVIVRCVVLLVVAAGCLKSASAQSAISSRQYPVGMKQIEYVDPSDGRHLALAMFYPAMPPASSAVPYRMRFFTNLKFLRGRTNSSQRGQTATGPVLPWTWQ